MCCWNPPTQTLATSHDRAATLTARVHVAIRHQRDAAHNGTLPLLGHLERWVEQIASVLVLLGNGIKRTAAVVPDSTTNGTVRRMPEHACGGSVGVCSGQQKAQGMSASTR